jgi:hypothetical protein
MWIGGMSIRRIDSVIIATQGIVTLATYQEADMCLSTEMVSESNGRVPTRAEEVTQLRRVVALAKIRTPHVLASTTTLMSTSHPEVGRGQETLFRTTIQSMYLKRGPRCTNPTLNHHSDHRREILEPDVVVDPAQLAPFSTMVIVTMRSSEPPWLVSQPTGTDRQQGHIFITTPSFTVLWSMQEPTSGSFVLGG